MADGRLRTLAHPVAGPAAERPLLALWTASMLALVVPLLPLVPVAGYLTRLVAASARGDSAPDPLERPRSLLRRSLLATVVSAAYLGIPLALVLVTVYGATTGGPPSGIGGARRLLFVAGSTLVLTLAVAGAYCWPIGLLAVGRGDGLRGAFDPGLLRRVGTHAAYFVGWIRGALVVLAAALLAGVASGAGRAGPVLGSLVAAYGVLLAAHLWGSAVGRTRGR